jgi:hypothetical protein
LASVGRETMKAAIVLLHRYLGVAFSLLMASWCLSGIVMMYVAFPGYGGAERVKDLAPLDFETCCDLNQARAALGDRPIDGFDIAMQAERPVLYWSDSSGPHALDLRSGTINARLSAAEAMQIVAAYRRHSNSGATSRFLGTVEQDQWTVSGGYARYAPLLKFALDDREKTELYVSARTGQIVQRTTRRQRVWNYFGAVTHWLYFTPLKKHSGLWTQLVIWLAVAGTFLTITGLYLGIAALRLGKSATRFSPYRGMNLWHHMAGLSFGLLTLAWVGSGLISMNPWGFLDSRYGLDDNARLSDLPLTTTLALDTVAALAHAHGVAAAGLLQVSAAPLNGHLFLIAEAPDGRRRLDGSTFDPAPLVPEELARASARLQKDGGLPVVERLQAGDKYFYSDHEQDFHPAYRVILDDSEHSRYYFDATSGALLITFDRAARGYRWMFNAIHRWDFSPGIRRRPLWDIVVVTLLLGVTVGSLSGVYLGICRVIIWIKAGFSGR